MWWWPCEWRATPAPVSIPSFCIRPFRLLAQASEVSPSAENSKRDEAEEKCVSRGGLVVRMLGAPHMCAEVLCHRPTHASDGYRPTCRNGSVPVQKASTVQGVAGGRRTAAGTMAVRLEVCARTWQLWDGDDRVDRFWAPNLVARVLQEDKEEQVEPKTAECLVGCRDSGCLRKGARRSHVLTCSGASCVWLAIDNRPCSIVGSDGCQSSMGMASPEAWLGLVRIAVTNDECLQQCTCGCERWDGEKQVIAEARYGWCTRHLETRSWGGAGLLCRVRYLSIACQSLVRKPAQGQRH